MPTEKLSIKVDEKGALVVSRNINEIGKSAKQTGGALQLLKRALGLLAGAVVIKQLIGMADAFTVVQNKLRQVTTSTANLNDVTDDLAAIAGRTRSSFVDTAEGYAKIALAGKELGQTQQQLLQFTESLNKAVIIGGSSSTEAAGGLRQLSQGLASGALRGDELISVLENLPFVADIIAKQLGVTRGELRKLGAQGKITANDVIAAFKAQREEIDEKFGRTIPTVNEAVSRLTDTFLKLIGEFNNSKGITKGLATNLLAAADALAQLGAYTDTLTVSVISLGVALGGVKLVAWAKAASGATTVMGALNVGVGALRTGLIALQAAMGPIAIALIAISAAAIGTTLYFDKLKQMQQEIFDIEEKIYKDRLARVQAQVQEIKNRKIAEQGLKDFIVLLNEEARVSGLTKQAKAEEIALLKASQIAKRDLSDEEKLQVTQALALTDAMKQNQAMLKGIRGPQEAYIEQLATLERIKPQLSAKEHRQELERLQEAYAKTDSVQTYLDNLAFETELLTKNNTERALAVELRRLEQEKGSALTPTETQDVTTAFTGGQELAREKALLEQILGPQAAYAQKVADLNKLREQGDLTQQQFNRTLADMGGFEAQLAALKEENTLLQMTGEQRQRRLLLTKLQDEAARSGQDLSTEQADELAAQIAANNELARKVTLLEEIKGPQRELVETQRLLNQLRTDGEITTDEFTAAMARLREETKETSKMSEEAAITFDALFNGASQALDTFLEGGIVTFRGFADSVIKDIARMMGKLLLLNALNTAFGGFDIGGFATGGSFTVGGSGGTDSQLVAFKATPGERVDVLTPGQQQQATSTGGTSGEAPVINIINVRDPDEIPDIMASAKGEQVIINVLSNNKDAVREVVA